jgi:hypothetical protein
MVRKPKTYEPINITIDPEILAEMRAEAAKPEEQRIKERDEFLNMLYDSGISKLMDMKSEISPSKKQSDEPPTAPTKKPGRFDDIIF